MSNEDKDVFDALKRASDKIIEEKKIDWNAFIYPQITPQWQLRSDKPQDPTEYELYEDEDGIIRAREKKQE